MPCRVRVPLIQEFAASWDTRGGAFKASLHRTFRTAPSQQALMDTPLRLLPANRTSSFGVLASGDRSPLVAASYPAPALQALAMDRQYAPPPSPSPSVGSLTSGALPTTPRDLPTTPREKDAARPSDPIASSEPLAPLCDAMEARRPEDIPTGTTASVPPEDALALGLPVPSQTEALALGLPAPSQTAVMQDRPEEAPTRSLALGILSDYITMEKGARTAAKRGGQPEQPKPQQPRPTPQPIAGAPPSVAIATSAASAACANADPCSSKRRRLPKKTPSAPFDPPRLALANTAAPSTPRCTTAPSTPRGTPAPSTPRGTVLKCSFEHEGTRHCFRVRLGVKGQSRGFKYNAGDSQDKARAEAEARAYMKTLTEASG